MKNFKITRRNLCFTSMACGAALAFPPTSWSSTTSITAPVDTTLGKVSGTRTRGVSKFLGIPYGADTSGKNRFMPPEPAQSWNGVRACTSYGNSSPQGVLPFSSGSASRSNPEIAKVMGTLFGSPGEKQPPISEDCLVLNVWTPDTSTRQKRPVLFWLHGGGFAQGNGSSSNYEGTNLCLRGDVVVVTINHRLTAAGYLYLGGFHEDFADSGNVGQLDQIMALRWVRDNIAAFGGDPNNVTIFGESGGGAKVSALLAMPDAKGLFHKAIIQSGPGLEMSSIEDAHRLAERTLGKLGIQPGDVHKLQSIDYHELIKAALESQQNDRKAMRSKSLMPVVDGRSLPRHPFEPDAPAVSAEVPVIVGTCRDEATLFTLFDPMFGKMTEEEVKTRFKGIFGTKANDAFELIRELRPQDSPTYWYTTMMTAVGTWNRSIQLAERKQAQGEAPAYMYRLDWETPVLDGVLRAPHGLDTSLVFDNAAVGGGIVGPGENPHKIAADMSQSWINFARNGDPSLDSVNWPEYEPTSRHTLIFDLPSTITSDPDRELREFFL